MNARAKKFRFTLNEAHKVVIQALANTYAQRSAFSNESDFKFELYHQLHDMELSDQVLGEKIPKTPSCILHSEAKAENGNAKKADLLICNPTVLKPFNYRTEIAIELKLVLNRRELVKEIEKFSGYGDGSVKRLYVIAGNGSSLSRSQTKDVLAAYPHHSGKVKVLDRDSKLPSPKLLTKSGDGKGSLKKRVADCIKDALKLYGSGREQYNGFFWCNYEHETGKGWTFPVEGDLNAQLYHRLRDVLPKTATVRTEYAAGGGRVDFYVAGPRASVGIEVKMNWDQFKPKTVNKDEEVDAIAKKFKYLHSNGKTNHSNFLVVIQGEDGHKSDHKAKAIRALKESRVRFVLYSYNERINRPAVMSFPD